MLVHLSRLVDESYRTEPSCLLSPSSTWSEQQRKVWVSVGALPLIRVGDIWRDGRFEAMPDYELEQFNDVKINTDTSVLVKAGLNLEDKGFLLPRGEHPWHMQCTQSYCLMVTLQNGRRLIIPCMELIRFYFGSSSNLLTKLFLPPLSQSALHGDGYFSQLSGRLVLHLAAGISGTSAADVGRIFMDHTAWRAALLVGTSLLKASTSGQPAYPQAVFPFEGRSNLVASGKWLSFGGESRATFLVYSLRSCSHPFPFKSLRYHATSRRSSTSVAQSSNVPGAERPKIRKQSPNVAGEQLVEQDASVKLASQSRSIWNAARFPDLATKTIWKSRTLLAASEGAINAGATPAVDHAAVGSAVSSKRVRSVDLQIRARSQSEYPVPDFLKAIVHELMALEGLMVDLLTDSDEDGWTIPIALLADEDGVISDEFFVQKGIDDYRERRVAVFSIATRATKIYLVVIEDSPIHVKRYLDPANSSRELWDTVRCAAKDFVTAREPKRGHIAELLSPELGSPK
jgi:hypothetical protein